MKHRAWIFPAALCVLAACAALYAAPGEKWIFPRALALAPQLSAALTGVTPKLILAAAILGLTAAFGRWHCLLLCPAGITQELFSRIGGALRLRRLRYVAAPGKALLPGLVGLATVFGMRIPAQMTDPAGLFGRFALPLSRARDFLIGGGGTPPASGGALAWIALIAGALLLVVLPLFKGRLFCDRFCPVGALLGVAARAGGKGPAIDAGKCLSCGACETVCPVQCADAKGKAIDPGRCLSCGACADVCRPGAIGLARSGRDSGERRAFLGSAVAGAAGVFALSRPISGMFSLESPAPPATPPGTGGDLRHRQFCIGCQACVAACPMNILRVQSGSDLRPVLDYERGFCHYACRDCLDSCPAGAFLPLSLEEKQRVRVAAVRLELSRCVVLRNGTECGACAEVCPTHAVGMVEQGGGRPSVPDFDPAFCVGCGACYHACPAEPRAFIVRGLARHETAQGIRETPEREPAAPAKERTLPGPGELTDFPF